MTDVTVRQKLEALDDLSRTTGKPRSEILASVGESWGLTVWQRATLAAEIERTPEPESTAARTARQAAAATADAKLAADTQTARAEARATLRALRASNPFAAARFAAENPTVYDDDPTPEAA